MTATGLNKPFKIVFAVVFSGLVACSAWAQQTDANKQSQNEIVDLVNGLILDKAQAYDGTAEISVGEIDLRDYAQCDNLDARISGSGDLRPTTTVVVSCLQPEKWRLYVKANVKIMGEYYVASRVIQRDETITANDLETRSADLLRKRKAITNSDNIIGWISNRRIASGSTISFNTLRDPNSIARGQQVSTIAQGLGFVINGVGQAISAGPPGSQIQVRTPNGKVITGTVIDAHTVQIPM